MRTFMLTLATVVAFTGYSFAPTKPAATVYVCDSSGAVAYHCNRNCSGLGRCKHDVIKLSTEDAKGRGLRECRICYK